MIRTAVLFAASAALLGGCSSGSDGASGEAEAPPPPPLTEAQKVAVFESLPAPWSAADLDNGRRAAARCRSCHTFTPGGPNMTGPNLHGVFGRKSGGKGGYNYSNALEAADFAWDGERLDHWLENPKQFLPGNKMSFAGLPDPTDRRDLIAWLMVETAPPPAA